ncbi:MAG TPA: M3 family metallopeptidase [Steroidobacteraceae bacterium]|nr:M3 family metallopeptidase [Steroidobacteraceae bacterium]
MRNPLLADEGLPAFDLVGPDDAEPALRARLEDNRRCLQELLAAEQHTFAGLIEPIEIMQHRMNRTWSPVSHLNAVKNSEPLRRAYNACLPLISEYQTELGQNEALQRAYQQILDREASALDAEQRKLLENALRDFRLAGVALDRPRKERFKELMQKLAREQALFEEHVLDSAAAWSRSVTDTSLLAGLPQAVIARAAAIARERSTEGWLLTLDQPTYQAVLTHAHDAGLRREFYEAWNTRASDRFPRSGDWNNAPVIENILRWRHEAARLLDFAHYTEYSLATKMARSAAEVRAFLESLAQRCVPVARRELNELESFAGHPLEAWDVPYYAERLQQRRFAISDEELRPYFPLPRVLQGLFKVAQRLYGISMLERRDIPVWDAHVRYFEIHDARSERIGGFYFDPYARPGKRSGAWMDECLGRLETPGERVLPVAYLVCNLLPPTDGQAALLSHDEVITLFHEFGHGLHHLLTRVRYPSVAGINGVPWDAVELPSQFMENFAWNPEVLELISGHVANGAHLPRAMSERLLGTRTFHAGLRTVRQLEFALFDLRLHSEYQPERGARVAEILQDVRAHVAVVPVPEFNRFAMSFGHIFAGGYAAGYYSYKWAEVLAADAFAAFQEGGVFNAAIAQRFLDAILSRGGSRDALEAFIEFRGREPDIAPLLRQFGIAA